MRVGHVLIRLVLHFCSLFRAAQIARLIRVVDRIVFLGILVALPFRGVPERRCLIRIATVSVLLA